MNAYSNSELQSWKNCPLQWRLFWQLHLRRLDDETSDHHLRYGQAFHEGLARLYAGDGLTAARDAFLDAYPRQLDASDMAKTRENGVETLVAYAKRWRDEDKQWRVLEIETRSDDPWSVKPDVVLENVSHGGIYLMDHKTTGQYLNYRYWEKYQPNSQITHYLDYAQSKYGPIEGFIINAIMFRYRERAYKGEPAGFWCAFERQTFNRNRQQIEQERASRAEWIHDLESSVKVGQYRTNTDQCWKCQYRPICAAGWTWEDDAELIALQYYQACDKRFGNNHCTMEVGHAGECGFREVAEPVEIAIEL